MEINFTIVKKRATPLFQALFALGAGWVGIILVKVWPGHPVATEYLAAFVAIIFFTIINIVVSIANESFLRYTMPSFYLYIALVAVLLLSAKFMSGVSIWKLEEYRMMLLSISIFYFVASVLVRGVRAIYEAAERGF